MDPPRVGSSPTDLLLLSVLPIKLRGYKRPILVQPVRSRAQRFHRVRDCVQPDHSGNVTQLDHYRCRPHVAANSLILSVYHSDDAVTYFLPDLLVLARVYD